MASNSNKPYPVSWKSSLFEKFLLSSELATRKSWATVLNLHCRMGRNNVKVDFRRVFAGYRDSDNL